MTIRRCDKCAEYDIKDKYCDMQCESKNPGNTCIEWIDDKERIKNTREINAARGFHEDISVETYNQRYL